MESTSSAPAEVALGRSAHSAMAWTVNLQETGSIFMTIPFPSRVSLLPTFVFTSLLVLVELLEGTTPLYSSLIFAFCMLSVIAFNTVGGFSRPSGGYIAFYALLVVIVGTVYKALLGQPAQSNLPDPILMIATYVATMAGMLLAGFISSKIATTSDGIAGIFNVHERNFGSSALGCLLIHIIIITASSLLPDGGGQVLHSLLIINPFLLLSVVLGTIAAVRDSHGRRSTNVISICTLVYLLVSGLLSFSKQGMFLPAVCWLLGAAWTRFRLRGIHIACLFLYLVCAFEVFAPISANRDDLQNGSTDERLALIEHYLTHLGELHERSTSTVIDEHGIGAKMLYYGKPQGLWDRLSMIPNDALLISFSNQGHYRGYDVMLYYFRALVPHVLDAHRVIDTSIGGNAYTHEMGGLPDADTSTGISFSPTAEAYHIDGWRAVLILQPVIFLLLFLVVDSVCGDIRKHPCGLFLTLSFAHTAPEALLGGAVTALTYGSASVSIAVFVCGYITPVLGQLLSGKRINTPKLVIGEWSSRSTAATQTGCQP